MNSKQKYIYSFMLLVGVATFVSSTIYSPTAYAAISKDKFVNILCKGQQGPASSDAYKTFEEECKAKGKKNNKVTLGKSTYKFANWKNEKGADLKAALAAGVTTPKKLKEYREQKKKEEEADKESSNSGATNGCGGAETAIIKCNQSNSGSVDDNGLWGLLMLVINILTAGVGIVAVGGIVYGSILYTTAEDKADQVKKATDIITNVVIGLIAFALMWAVLNFIVPGGVFS